MEYLIRIVEKKYNSILAYLIEDKEILCKFNFRDFWNTSRGS